MASCGNCGGSGVSYFTGGTCANCKGSGQDPTGEPADWLFGSSGNKKGGGFCLMMILATIAFIALGIGIML